jgi:hypothetical protein
MNNIPFDELQELLKKAEFEHKKYEIEIGKKDKDWPVWFAKYVIKRTYDI